MGYKPDEKKWVALPSMTTPRQYHAAAALDGKFYAIGGETEPMSNELTRAVASMEVLDHSDATWTPLRPMCSARASCAVAIIAGEIYVFGGWSARTLHASQQRKATELSSVERFNP